MLTPTQSKEAPGVAIDSAFLAAGATERKIMQFNPDGSHALTGALAWVANLLTGRLGTAVAILAIGWIGLLMLQGRIEWRRAVLAVAGAFLLFGAPSIARGLMDTATAIQPKRAPPNPPAPVATPSAPPQFDPYAGAAVPH